LHGSCEVLRAPSFPQWGLDTLSPVKRLIINADDFGLTPGVNRAIVELNTAGVLSSATLMANGPFFAEAVHLGFAQTTLAVGCHVVFTDGTPVLPPSEIPSLMDPGEPAGNSSGRSPGRFRPTVGAFVSDLLRGRIRGAELEAEAIAQIRRIQSSGLHVTHVDTHKHTHVFRHVLRPLLRAARQCEVRAVRNPFEPIWSVRATPRAGWLRWVQVHALRAACMGFDRIARQMGVSTTDGAIGLLATGTLDRALLRSLLGAIPDGTWELVCHPGYQDRALEETATRLRASRDIERKALLEAVPLVLSREHDFSLINFGELGAGS
jgi:chitin disaccharide deacetylase